MQKVLVISADHRIKQHIIRHLANHGILADTCVTRRYASKKARAGQLNHIIVVYTNGRQINPDTPLERFIAHMKSLPYAPKITVYGESKYQQKIEAAGADVFVELGTI